MNYENNGNYNNGYNGYNNGYNQVPQQPVRPQPTMEPVPQPIPETPQEPLYPNQGGNLYDFSSDLNQNNNTNQMVEIEPPKKKKRFSFFAFLEFLIIVFLCLYIANDLGYIHIKQLDNLIPAKETKKEEPKQEEKKEMEKTENTITDEKLIQDISVKAYYVSNIGVNFSNFISPIFGKTTKIEDLSSQDKLQSIIMGFSTVEQNAYTKLSDQTEFKEVFPSLPQENISSINYIDANKVKEKYKDVYGEEIENASINNTCPIVVYNEKYSHYYINPFCDRSDAQSSIDQYVYKVTALGDEYYAYISIAPYRAGADGTVTVYKDYRLEERYKDYSKDEFANFRVSDVYKDLSKYKMTFTKTDSGYSFKSIEAVKDEVVEG